MVKKIIHEGEKAGFSTTEVYRKKIDKTSYDKKGQQLSSHQINTDRISIRAFRDTGDPLGFTLSVPTIQRVRDAFQTMYNGYIPDKTQNFTSTLPRSAGTVKMDIYDSRIADIGPPEITELYDRMAEVQMGSFPGLKAEKFQFTKFLKKIYITNSRMLNENDLKIKYRKSLFSLNILFSWKDNLIEINETRPYFSQLNPDKIVSRAYNLLNSLTEKRTINVPVKQFILSPEASATLVREFADYFKISSKNRLKNIFFPPPLTIVDNPVLPNHCGSVPFDDEGIQTDTHFLIEKGVIKQSISNLQESFERGLTTTGNGYRSQKKVFPETGFSNLYIKPSVLPLSKLLYDAYSGILISLLKLRSVQDGVYTFSAYGYQFENGNIGEPVHIFLKTTALSFFLNIVKVSKELKFFYHRFNIGSPYIMLDPGTQKENLFEL